MKIVLVIDQFDDSNNGTTVTARRFAGQLRRRGHEVVILAGGAPCEGKICAPVHRIPVFQKLIESQGMCFAKPDEEAYYTAFKDADIVYPKSWAPFKAMEKRSELYVKGDQKGIDELEKELLAQNAEHKDWTCSEEMMKLTKDGKALYLHCLPADISGLSCPEGEVDNSVFDRYLVPLYKQASYKPYIIAAMIFLAQVKDPVKALMELDAADNKRKML